MSASKLDIRALLSDGDLRTVGRAKEVIASVKTQHDFDQLFSLLYEKDRRVQMRAADIVEKITRNETNYLRKYKKQVFDLFLGAVHKEFKWHLAAMITRVKLSEEDLGTVWDKLYSWATSNQESRIVRVNSMHALFDLTMKFKDLGLQHELMQVLEILDQQDVPSIKARVRMIRKKLNVSGKTKKG